MNQKENIFLGILLLLTLLIWSSAFTAIHIGLSSFDPANLAILRYLIASFVLLLYGKYKNISFPDFKDLPIIAVCGFLGVTVYHLTLNHGETLVSAGTASIISNSYPIFVAVLSAIFLKEKVCLTKWTGITISFLGILVITLGSGNGINLSFGALLILISSIASGFHTIIGKKLMEKYSPLEITCYIIWAGTFFLLFFGKSLFADVATASKDAVYSVLYLGVFPGAFAYLAWNKVLAKGSATDLTNTQNVIPIFALVISFLFLREVPTTIMITGGTVAIGGILIVNYSEQLKQFAYRYIDRSK
mgnify:CR=1 FL=1